MFFYLSKILLFLIKPLVWVVFIYLRSVFTKDELKRKRRLIIATILLFLFSNNFLVNELAMLYENHSTNPLDSTYDVGIVLGGFAAKDKNTGETVFYDASDRFLQALKLLKQGKIKRLIVSSGSTSILNNIDKEADAVKRYCKSIGIADSLVIAESHSRNTLENATFSFKTIDSLGIKTKPLVITSAWHIPRAKLCFNNDKHKSDYYATNYIGSGKRELTIENLLAPSTSALYNLELLVKEWVGYGVYLVKRQGLIVNNEYLFVNCYSLIVIR